MINKAALMRSVKKSTGLSLRDASTCIDSVFETITEGISRDERIELRGFGTFFVRITAPRKTMLSNSASVVPSHGRIVFRPSQKLRQSAWNKPGSK